MSIIQTVLGPITPNLLGRTLTHEHFSIDFSEFYVPPPDDLQSFLDKKITLENVGFIKQYPYSCRYNLNFADEEAAEAVRKDVELYKKLGGGSIVENSSHGLGRNLELMCNISRSTGVHVIAGTGHYTHNVQTSEILNSKVEELTDLYSKEIITGCDVGDANVRCGFIGEVGSGWPINDFERHAILATGEIQEVVGCGVSFHPGRNKAAPSEIVRLYLEAGGKADKCVMSHLERTIQNIEELLEFAEMGTYIQYDLFGTECSYYQLNSEIDMPSDADRINNLIKLLEEKIDDRILISHDIHTKHRLTSFGGHGFSHIHTNVLPRLFEKGVTVEQVEKITVQNPAKWLQYKA